MADVADGDRERGLIIARLLAQLAVRQRGSVVAGPQVVVSFVSSWGAGGEPELPERRETMRNAGEGFGAEPWTERDDGLVIHPHEAAEFGDSMAGRGWPLAGADGAEQMAALGRSVREQGSEIPGVLDGRYSSETKARGRLACKKSADFDEQVAVWPGEASSPPGNLARRSRAALAICSSSRHLIRA